MASNKAAPREERTRRDTRLPLVAAPRLAPAAGYRASLRSVLVGPSVTPRVMRSPGILIFDSGLGGLTVFREIARARPDARLVYAADDALFPYGEVAEGGLIERVVALMAELIASARARSRGDRLQHGLDAGAAGTARAFHRAVRRHRAGDQARLRGLADRARLRARHRGNGRARIYPRADPRFRRRLRRDPGRLGAACGARRSGAARRSGRRRRRSRAEIAPCFVEDGAARTDTVVLACTHYPLLLDRFERLAPWPVHWIDPAPAIARRVVELVGAGDRRRSCRRRPRAIFTSGRAPSADACCGACAIPVFEPRRIRRRAGRRFDTARRFAP